jgi:hypothetical protein
MISLYRLIEPGLSPKAVAALSPKMVMATVQNNAMICQLQCCRAKTMVALPP